MRIEKDSMGEMMLADDALYGASTQRAVLNFPISGHKMPEGFVRSMGLVKWACAIANGELGRIAKSKSERIAAIAMDIYDGKYLDQFPVDVFQTGSATSSNMNINEVIANQSLKSYPNLDDRLHPNDDVNLGQSSNDIMPTVLHVSVAIAIQTHLVPALEYLAQALEQKADLWHDIIKIGRTHLMDATPLTLGQVFSGYAAQVKKSIERAKRAVYALEELAIGGTAVGTGINGHPDFPKKVIELINQKTQINFRECSNHFEAQAARDDCVEVAGILSTIAASLSKIANDIRLLGSGPRCNIGEIILPATQPGSSIMPGKVNPVMSEMLIQACIYVMGLSTTVVACGKDGHFELNVTIPLITYAMHESVNVLANGANVFAEKCVEGLEADKKRCKELVERSLMLVTALTPYIGYDKAAMLAKKAYQENKTLKEVLIEDNCLDMETITKALDPSTMIHAIQ